MKGEKALQLCRKSEVFIRRHSPTILTCLGAVGVVATAISAVRATPKAVRMLEASEAEKGSALTKTEIVQVAGLTYIPTVVLGASTIACIFGANMLNKRQQAALISAYTLLDSSYKEYKSKVTELYGEDADINVRKEIAKDHYEDVDIELDDGKQLFYDAFSERYFEAYPEDVVKAEYEVNRTMINDGGAYLNDFYRYLDLPPIKSGYELGWSSGFLESNYWASWVEFDHTQVDMEDGMECTIITFRYEPMVDFCYY